MKWLKILLVKPICLTLVLVLFILQIILRIVIGFASRIQSLAILGLCIFVLIAISGGLKQIVWYKVALGFSPALLLPQVLGLIYGVLEVIQKKLIEL